MNTNENKSINNGKKSLYIGVGVVALVLLGIVFFMNGQFLQGEFITRPTNTKPVVRAAMDCTTINIQVIDKDVSNPTDMVVDVYLDSDTDHSTRFDRFNAQHISITPQVFPELFPTDQNHHTIIVWVKDFNSIGQPVGKVNGWEMSYSGSWDRSKCFVNNVVPVSKAEILNCELASISVIDTDVPSPDKYEVDVYLDSDVDHSTRFDRFYNNNIAITSKIYPELFPREGTHSLIVWVKDFNEYGMPVGTGGADSWVKTGEYKWNTDDCARDLDVNP
jgi:hypothetical protein